MGDTKNILYTRPNFTELSKVLSSVNLINFVLLSIMIFLLFIKLQNSGINEQRVFKRILSKFRRKSKQGFIFNELELKEIEKDVTILEKILISKENAYTPTYQVIIYDRDYDLLVKTMVKIGMLKPNTYR